MTQSQAPPGAAFLRHPLPRFCYISANQNSCIARSLWPSVIQANAPSSSHRYCRGIQRQPQTSPASFSRPSPNCMPRATKYIAMASIVRPALLRQTVLASAASRCAKAAPLALSSGSRSAFCQPATRRFSPGNQTRVAAFHATSQRNLLPPPPRKPIPRPSGLVEDQLER